LVDDGSTDGTAEMVKQKLPGSVILYGNGNLWWGGALQKAYEHIKKVNVDPDDCVLIVNDDNTIKEEFLEIGVRLTRNNQKSVVSALGYSENDGTPRCVPLRYVLETGETLRLNPGDSGNCVSSRSLFMQARDFIDIGGFHPRLLPHYGSDHEYTIRAWKKGYQIKSFLELRYIYNEDMTGNREYSKYSKLELLKALFSKKSSFNPIYKLFFILLVTPMRFVPKVIFNQASSFIKKISSG